jgi:hypothetical protein
MSLDTNIHPFKEDLGKNLYRKKTYYTLCVEQEVLAKNKDDADNKFMDGGGINHSNIGRDLTDENQGVETYMVDANYTDSGDTEYVAKVCYEDDEFAKEDGFVELDTYALEDDIINEKGDCVAKEKEIKPLDDLKKIVDEHKPIKAIL